MLFVRVSPNRILLINEFWILIPAVLTLEIAIVVKVRNNRAQKHLKSKKLKEDLRRWKIFHFANRNIFSSMFVRGGQEVAKMITDGFMEVTHQNCIVAKGVQFLDNAWLRKLITIQYSDKIKNGILFITRTALCHYASQVGLSLLDTKIIKISSWLTLGQKTLATLLTLSPITLLGIWGATTTTIVLSVVTFLSGTGSMFFIREADIFFIKTQAIAGSLSQIRQRIKDRTDVVVIDLEPSSDKITMEKSSVPYECSLPDQRLGNPTCVRKTKVSETGTSGNVVVDILIDYDDVVNMEDVTGLNGDIKFADQFETIPIQKPGPIKAEHSRPNPGKKLTRTASLLEKFGDPEHIPDTETWDTSINTEHNIGTKK